MASAPDEFEKWWQSVKLGGFMNDEIMPDHVRQAFDLGVMFERQRCAKITRDLWHDPEGAYTADYVEAAILDDAK